MQKNKNIAFDIGDVIGYVNFTDFLNLLSEIKNISQQEAYSFLSRIQRLHDLGISYLKDELIDHFDIKSNVILDKILNCWQNVMQLDPFMMEYIQKKLNENFTIALVSNIGFEHAEWVKNQMLPKLKYNKDQIITFFSCDVGARKPTYLYFKTFIEMYPDFKDCVYVDDRPENLNSGSLFNLIPFNFSLKNANTEEQKKLEIQKLETTLAENTNDANTDFIEYLIFTTNAE